MTSKTRERNRPALPLFFFSITFSPTTHLKLTSLTTMPKVAKAAKVSAAGGKKKLAEPVKAAPPPKEDVSC